MLDEHADEALHRAEGRPVDHHGAVRLVVGADVFEFETVGQVVVHLDGAELPRTAEGILHHEVEFGAVECRFAGNGDGFQAGLSYGFDDGAFGFFPVFVRANVLRFIVGVAQGNLGCVTFKTQFLQNEPGQFEHAEEFFFHLFRSAKKVGVILRETAHACQAVQFAALLVAIDGAELGDAQRQFFVGAWFVAEDFAVVRAVHGFQQKLLALAGRVDGLEAVLCVFLKMPAGDVQLFFADVRGDDGCVSPEDLLLLEEVFEAAAQGGAFGQPDGQAGADFFGEHEKFEFLAELAVVSFFGFFEHFEVLGQLLLFGKGDAIKPGELLAFFVATPIGAGDGHEFRSLYFSRIGDVRPLAEVGEIALVVKGDIAVLQLINQLQLVLVAFPPEIFEGIGFAHFLAFVGVALAGEFEHFVFDFFEIVAGNLRAAGVHVVIKAIVHRRADT